MTSAVKMLVAAGAETSYRTPDEGKTLCHLCAENLDGDAISALLSAKGLSKPDPSALDSFGRTPMFLAVVTGTSAGGQRSPSALDGCIRALKASGGQLTIDLPKWTQHPLSILAASCQAPSIVVLVKHLQFSFPLKNSGGLQVDCSLGSFYDYPVHSAIISFVERVENFDGKSGPHPCSRLSETLNVLLDMGFEPNERLDDTPFARKVGLRFVGYSPVQLLGLAALLLEKVGPKLGQKLYGDLDSIVSTSASVLVGKGARLNLEAPPAQRVKTATPVDLGEEEESLRGSLKLDTNKRLQHLLGGLDLLSDAKGVWIQKGKIEAGATLALRRDDSMNIEDNEEPGGSSTKSCAVCWKQFGTLTNRKHKCRSSWRYVCDECSTKRLVRGGKDYRVSDGQYLLAAADLVKKGSQSERKKSIPVKNAAMEKLERLQAEEDVNRKNLFGGALEHAASFVFGEQDEAARTNQSLGGLATTMGETRNALLERGDKLSSMNDKTAEMVDASAKFAKMAKELRKKSEQGLFW